MVPKIKIEKPAGAFGAVNARNVDRRIINKFNRWWKGKGYTQRRALIELMQYAYNNDLRFPRAVQSSARPQTDKMPDVQLFTIGAAAPCWYYQDNDGVWVGPYQDNAAATTAAKGYMRAT